MYVSYSTLDECMLCPSVRKSYQETMSKNCVCRFALENAVLSACDIKVLIICLAVGLNSIVIYKVSKRSEVVCKPVRN